MIEVGARRRKQPAPPRIVFEALTHPTRDSARPWLHLLEDEHLPAIIDSEPLKRVVWSSIWPQRPDARIAFQLPLAPDGYATDLLWTLSVDAPPPDESLLGHMRKRINTLINADLRFAFGQ